MPEVVGIWDDVYHQIYQLYKRQRKSRRKLTAILNRYQKSTQALPYATIILNQSNEIEWFNPAAKGMFDLHNKSDVGQRIGNLIRQPVFIQYLAKKEFTKSLKFSTNQINIILSITPYGDGQFLVSARDITAVSKLDKMRRDFISNASHELRTPLTVISGYVEFLQHNTDEKIKKPLDNIQTQTLRMEKIISELIELAKLESSISIDYTKTVDVETLLNDVYNEALAFDNNKHNITLDIEIQNSTSKNNSKLNGSYEEIRMALSNLMTNAIRYTNEGGTIKLFSQSHGNNLSIGVQDSGTGINYKHIPRLTERFYRVDKGRSREYGGTGLGLSIVKHVLDRHNATLQIQSEQGKGSTFRCDFPSFISANIKNDASSLLL